MGITTTTEPVENAFLNDRAVVLAGVNESNALEAAGITGGGAHTFETGQMAGERNADSATNSYMVARPQWNVSIISKTTAVTIGAGAAGDTYLGGLYIHTALTGTCVITGFADSDGTAQSYTIPAGAVGAIPLSGENSAGALTITCSTAGDDNKVWVQWRPI
jgi:hypothetical protein